MLPLFATRLPECAGVILVAHTAVAIAIAWALEHRFLDDNDSQRQFSNPKQSSGKQIDNNFKQWSKRFLDGNSAKISPNWMATAVTFAYKHVQFKRLRLLQSTNQARISSNVSAITTFPTHVDALNLLYVIFLSV